MAPISKEHAWELQLFTGQACVRACMLQQIEMGFWNTSLFQLCVLGLLWKGQSVPLSAQTKSPACNVCVYSQIKYINVLFVLKMSWNR